MSADVNGYQGWKNWETWNVALWIDNEQGSHEFWRERALENPHGLAEELHESFEESATEYGLVGALSDLLSAALRKVDWDELAQHFVSDAIESAVDRDALIGALRAEIESLPVDEWESESVPEDERYLNVRLQVVDGTWHLHVGDPSFDTDHRGIWTADSLTPESDPEGLADDLIEGLE